MRYIIKHSNFRESRGYEDELEYIRLCFVDMFDRFGEYDENSDNDGLYIAYDSDDNLIRVILPQIWIDGMGSSKKGITFDSIDTMDEYYNTHKAYVSELDDCINKFSTKYNFSKDIWVDDYINVNIYHIVEK